MEHVHRIKSAEIGRDTGLSDYPDLVLALEHWGRLCDGRRLPPRGALDPADIKPLLPRVMLVDVLPGEPPRFRYRLSGTAVCNAHGRDLKDLYPEDMQPPAYGRLIARHYLECCQRCEPLTHVIVLQTTEKQWSYARIILPFGDAEGGVSHLLVVDSEHGNSLAECLDRIDARCAPKPQRLTEGRPFHVVDHSLV